MRYMTCMPMKLAIWLLAAAPALAAAAVDCRMPNGKVVKFNLGQCPADAAQLDAAGKVVRPPVPASVKAVPSTPAPAAKAAPETHVVKPRQPKVFEVAEALCTGLRSQGAVSECKVDVSVFSASTMDLTVAESPRTAWASCIELRKAIRAAAPEDAARGNWQIRMFSPYGSGTRPIATCDF